MNNRIAPWKVVVAAILMIGLAVTMWWIAKQRNQQAAPPKEVWKHERYDTTYAKAGEQVRKYVRVGQGVEFNPTVTFVDDAMIVVQTLRNGNKSRVGMISMQKYKRKTTSK